MNINYIESLTQSIDLQSAQDIASGEYPKRSCRSPLSLLILMAARSFADRSIGNPSRQQNFMAESLLLAKRVSASSTKRFTASFTGSANSATVPDASTESQANTSISDSQQGWFPPVQLSTVSAKREIRTV
jgi:hypothetical protein